MSQRLHSLPCAPDEEKLKDRVHERLLPLCEVDPETECWIFVGSWERGGAGVIKVGGTQRTVGRVAAWLYLGVALDDRSVRVRHTCGMPACSNPDHLLVVGPAGRNELARSCRPES
jgi:hypothetical protein